MDESESVPRIRCGMDTVTHLPDSFSSGSTVRFRRHFADFPADGGWSYELFLAGPSTFSSGIGNITVDGATFVVTLAASDTVALNPGPYRWVERVTAGGEPFDAAWGSLIVTPNLATAAPGDNVSEAEKAYSEAWATYRKRMAADLSGYSIEGRAAKKEELAQLWKAICDLGAMVAAERRAGRQRPPRVAAFTSPGIAPGDL